MASQHLRSRIVRLALAALLLTAAFLEGRQLLGDSTAILPGLLHAPILIAALIQSEFLLALWLLVGGYEAMHTIQNAGVIRHAETGPQVLLRRLQDCQG